MATYKKGILGVFSGKVGTVVGSSWKGISYMKSLPKASSKTPSRLQLDQRLRFGLVTSFLKPIQTLTNIGYGSVKGSLTAYNAAVSYHLNAAVVGDASNFEIDYPRVIFSRGELPSPAVPSLLAGAGAEINFSWADNSTANLAKPTDRAVLLVYNPVTKEFVFDDTATRVSAGAVLSLPPNFIGETLHAWMAFFASDDKQVSTSIYLGTVVAN
ncbi:DUF6266 family protein [Pedobacter xixiisoli]|uniref:Uncharacterized protein n=1 Tax=Pedobacter xixiisoli TaxID=1476464 RepID=A0A285ZZQ5_9SPHI|nr:DUF6266 family protein [Pedobacter xixiisoli]SOD15120.1 hypothetical protein SAMN06297358_2095 [Pedobacter xixiisoli]